jgi:hypothetical protein
VHQHAVSLATLVGGGDASFSIDIVLWRGARIVGCVEVGAGGELSNETYRRRRAYKRGVLAGEGIPVHECDLRGGQRTMEALRHCIAWVQAQLGLPRSIDESFLRGVWTHPGITTVSYASVEEHRQWLRSHAITTVDDYELKRIAQLKEGDELAGRIVPRGTLGNWLRANSMDWYELTGRPPTGRGSAKARRGSATHQFYASYAETREAARQLGATTPTEFQEMRASDPRLRPNPDAYWPTEFKEDGWSGFLGTGASTLELAGMVSSNDARQAIAMGHGRWIKTIRTLRPDATRRRGKDRYFRPAHLVLHLVEAGVVGNAEADEVRGRLDKIARTRPHDLKTSAR